MLEMESVPLPPIVLTQTTPPEALYLTMKQSYPPPTLETPLRPEEVRRQLTENEAQRKEVTGYINQLSIQLHRWQLRLQKLDERHKELEKELASSGR